jgi:hypothetical protein
MSDRRDRGLPSQTAARGWSHPAWSPKRKVEKKHRPTVHQPFSVPLPFRRATIGHVADRPPPERWKGGEAYKTSKAGFRTGSAHWAGHEAGCEPNGSCGRHQRHAEGYRRHRPEQTALYRVVEAHWPEFRERAGEAGGLPRFVTREVANGPFSSFADHVNTTRCLFGLPVHEKGNR